MLCRLKGAALWRGRRQTGWGQQPNQGEARRGHDGPPFGPSIQSRSGSDRIWLMRSLRGMVDEGQLSSLATPFMTDRPTHLSTNEASLGGMPTSVFVWPPNVPKPRLFELKKSLPSPQPPNVAAAVEESKPPGPIACG